jgi:5-methylthioadenosine/S-adenosylhomocysteine deaminase
MWKEMMMASFIHNLKDPQGITPDTILKMSTLNGAKALGINAGVLKAGCLADIIIVDIKKPQFTSSNLISALVHAASGCDVKTTIVGGKLLMEDHELITLDEDKVIEGAKNAISTIMENG